MDVYMLCFVVLGFIIGIFIALAAFHTGRKPRYDYMLSCGQCNWTGWTDPMFLDEEGDHRNRFRCPKCNSIVFSVERYSH